MQIATTPAPEYETIQKSDIVKKALAYLQAKLKSKDCVIVHSSTEARDLATLKLSGLRNEHFWVCYLNASHKYIADEIVGAGTVNVNTVYHRNVMARVIEHNATSMIIGHNHPSGSLNISDQDIRLTQTFIAAFKMFDIKVLDHIVVGAGESTSLRDIRADLWKTP